MFDWVDSQATFVVALVAVLVFGVVAKAWRRRMTERAAHNVEHGITADQVGNPHIERLILSQSVELYLAAPPEQVAQLLATIRMPMLFDRIGDRSWGDRKTVEEAKSYGELEPADGGTRARMLWCADADGMPAVEGDWRALRDRLMKAAQRSGISVTEIQGPRMNRVPVGDAPAHLRPEQAPLAPHQWRAADVPA